MYSNFLKLFALPSASLHEIVIKYTWQCSLSFLVALLVFPHSSNALPWQHYDDGENAIWKIHTIADFFMCKHSPSNPLLFFLSLIIVHPNVILWKFNGMHLLTSCFWSEHFLTLIWFGEEASLTAGWVCNDGATGQGNDCNEGLEEQMSTLTWEVVCFGVWFSTICTGRGSWLQR